MEFLGEWEEDQRAFLLMGPRKVIVESSVSGGVIEDDDLAYVVKPYLVLARIAGAARDDIYSITERDQHQGIHFPLIQKFFCYLFAKGVESAYQWHIGENDDVDIAYDPDGAENGLFGIDATQDLADLVNRSVPEMENVFCDFQDGFIANPNFGFSQGGRWLADAIASGLFWSAAVGMDAGMNRLGFK